LHYDLIFAHREKRVKIALWIFAFFIYYTTRYIHKNMFI
jgi:hypothetical protein